jgi:transcriptional regulator with XRE-family HTH domain
MEETVMESAFSRKIKELRLAKEMTLEQVANIVGVGKSTVRKWETGMISNMGRDKIDSLAKALGVSPAYLMGWDDTAEPSRESVMLTPSEKALLEKFKQIPESKQEMLLQMLEIALNVQQ